MNVIDFILSVPRGIVRFFKRIVLGLKLVFTKRSYLIRTGYVYSKINDSLRNREGQFQPWMCYGMIDFLEDRLHKGLSIFEYGSGSSTLYFASKVGEVMSVEYDSKWYDKVQGLIDGTINAGVHYIDLNGPYVDAIEVLGKGKKFDLVIVDGRERVACALKAFDFVTENGVVLLDDTHRKHYKDAFDFYKDKGWKALTFSGMKPTGFGTDQSTLFYRSGQNCLDL